MGVKQRVEEATKKFVVSIDYDIIIIFLATEAALCWRSQEEQKKKKKKSPWRGASVDREEETVLKAQGKQNEWRSKKKFKR